MDETQGASGDDPAPGGAPPAAEMAGMERLMGHFNGSCAVALLGLGHQVGLISAMMDGGGTAAEVAAVAGTHERSTAEWLAGMTAAGYLQHDDGRFSFVEGQDAVFRPGLLPFDVTVFLEFQQKMAEVLPLVAGSLASGSGVPYSAYQPEFSILQDRLNGPLYESFLVDDFLASAEGVVEELERGAEVADVGCGGGQALCLLGKRFPRSSFTGFDIDGGAVEIARSRAREADLSNVSFEVQDAADLDLEDSFDIVVAVDAIHDQSRPGAVLERIARALRPGGTFVMIEPLASGDVDSDVQHPMAPMMYTTSLTHCVQVSLSGGGPGLGSMWGRATALPMLGEAGFSAVQVHESPADYAVYAARHDRTSPPSAAKLRQSP